MIDTIITRFTDTMVLLIYISVGMMFKFTIGSNIKRDSPTKNNSNSDFLKSYIERKIYN